jgi:hypothetical protein
MSINKSLYNSILILIENFYNDNVWSIHFPLESPLSRPLVLTTQQKIFLIRNNLASIVHQPVDSPLVDCLLGIIINQVPRLFQEIVTFCKKINKLTTTQQWGFDQIRNACLNYTLTVDLLFNISMQEFERVMADVRKRLHQAQGIHHDHDNGHDFTIIESPEDRRFKQSTREKCVELVPLYYRLFSFYQISSFVQFNRFARHESKRVD